MPLVNLSDLAKKADDFVARMEKARGLATEYDQFILQPRDNKERRPGIHASEVSGCKRKPVYSLLAYARRETINKNWRQRFQVGHATHAMLQADFHKMAKESGGLMDFEDEVKIAPELQPLATKWFINSSCDGVFTFYDEPGGPPVLRVGLEIKTEAMDGYDKLRAPKPEHIDQAHIYMATLDVPLMWFLYINKNNQNNTDTSGPFLITFDPAVWARLEAKFQELHDYAAREELPPREENKIGCQICGFSWTCQPEVLSGAAPTRLVKLFRR